MSVTWLGELPERWENKRLAAVLVNRRERNDPVQTDFILSLSAKSGVLPYSERTEKGGNKPKDDLTKYSIARKHDLLVNCMNVLAGSSGVTRWDGAISPVYYALYPRDEGVNIWYYNYIFRLITFYRSLIGLSKGILVHESESGNLNTIRLRIAMTNLNNVMLPLPPRDEQDQIVRYLDWKVSQINKLINAKRRQITLLQEQKRMVVNEAVTRRGEGWRQLRIKMAAKILRGKFSHRPRNDPALYDGEYPFIQTGDVARAGKHICDYKQTLNKNGFAVSKQFPKGTLTMTIAANIGDVAILDFDACFPDSIIGFIPYEGIDLEYLYYALYSMKADFVREAPINTQGNLNVERVGAMSICIPKLETQREIVQTIERCTMQIDTVIKKIQTEIALFTEYRTRLISDVVTGKLDVRYVAVPEYQVVEDVTESEDAEDIESMEDE